MLLVNVLLLTFRLIHELHLEVSTGPAIVPPTILVLSLWCQWQQKTNNYQTKELNPPRSKIFEKRFAIVSIFSTRTRRWIAWIKTYHKTRRYNLSALKNSSKFKQFSDRYMLSEMMTSSISLELSNWAQHRISRMLCHHYSCFRNTAVGIDFPYSAFSFMGSSVLWSVWDKWFQIKTLGYWEVSILHLEVFFFLLILPVSWLLLELLLLELLLQELLL